MTHPYRLVIFGKEGCEKCKVLQQRVDALLATGEWSDFEKVYADVETPEGLVAFCRTECVNPNRIPALVVHAWDAAAGRWEPLPRATPGAPDPVCGVSRLHTYVGIQTDYSGTGVLSPKMIRAVLEEARALHATSSAA